MTNNNPPQPADVAGVPEEVWLKFFDGNVRGVSVYVPEWYDDSPLNYRLRRIKDNGTRYVRATQPATAPGDADDLHLAICQAVALMNQGDLHGGHDLLRQTLVDFADKKAPLSRSEIVRQQQRSGAGEVTAVMVSSITPDVTERARRAARALLMSGCLAPRDDALLLSAVVEKSAAIIAAEFGRG